MTYYLNVLNNEIISYSELPVLECLNIEVTKSIYDDYINTPYKYYVVNGELRVRPQSELDALKEKEEKERLAKTYMTKWDFVKYILNPHDFTYSMLKEVLAKNIQLEEAWMCCSAIYRGDDTLCTNLPKLLPTVTTEFLDEAFKKHGTYGG